jgi:CheY-like chemotaxis protein
MLEVSISKKAQLRIRYAAELPRVEADPSQLRQLVMNLLVNASDALGDQSGVVSISTSVRRCDRAELSKMWLDEKLPEGRYVCLEVEDQGSGMDAETLGRIFDPFFTTKFTGRGLGLAVVLGIVRGHQGAIRVRRTPGQGTSFQVLLPVLEKPVSSTMPERQLPEVWTGVGRVLLVDDEEMVRSVGELMLTRLGFPVVTAPDGHAAVELVRENLADPAADRFVCVLLDLTMPRMDGEETCRALARLRPDLPVVLSSGYSEQEVLRRFEGLRLAGFAQKPYVLQTLRETMRRALEQTQPA